ncbi:uncharacterized protein [Lepisosteus oculatus]|uniref:uncharacterized protein n=1 Tax=Lepisosteus oculatus TaxID=7918 RepID=UPI0035F50A64
MGGEAQAKVGGVAGGRWQVARARGGEAQAKVGGVAGLSSSTHLIQPRPPATPPTLARASPPPARATCHSSHLGPGLSSHLLLRPGPPATPPTLARASPPISSSSPGHLPPATPPTLARASPPISSSSPGHLPPATCHSSHLGPGLSSHLLLQPRPPATCHLPPATPPTLARASPPISSSGPGHLPLLPPRPGPLATPPPARATCHSSHLGPGLSPLLLHSPLLTHPWPYTASPPPLLRSSLALPYTSA